MTPPYDYNQQLLAYLQAWRQLLEQWMNLLPGMPGPTPGLMVPPVPAAPGMPAAPVMPPVPPANPGAPAAPSPADYTQQLFGYLQAWRQYLEQATGGSPAPTTQQPAGSTGSTFPPDLVIAPDNDWTIQMPAGNLSTENFSRPNVRPDFENLSRDNLHRPFRPADQIQPSSRSLRPVSERRSAFAKTEGVAGYAASPQVTPQSLYSRRSAPSAGAAERREADRPRPRRVAEEPRRAEKPRRVPEDKPIPPADRWGHQLD